MERIKENGSQGRHRKLFFWKTSGLTPHELDFIEIENQQMRAFECKMSDSGKPNPGKDFLKAYPERPILVVSPSNIRNATVG